MGSKCPGPVVFVETVQVFLSLSWISYVQLSSYMQCLCNQMFVGRVYFITVDLLSVGDDE